MTLKRIDFSHMKPYRPRSFVPAEADLKDPQIAEKFYTSLLEREVGDPAGFEQWLLDRSEIDAVVDQERSVLYIQMTCHTDDEAFAKAYQDFTENVVPILKKLDDQLNEKYLTLKKRFLLDEKRYFVYDRAIRTDRELFRQENIPLATEVSMLSQEYQSVCGAMTVKFKGEEKTLPQMSMYLQETDRELRREAWEGVAARRMRDRDRLDDIFEKMLKLRHQMARNAGFENFMEFQFQQYHRFDYTPKECRDYHQAVEQAVVPLLKRVNEHRRAQMKLDSFRPWDTHTDPLGRPPLRPFEKVENLIEGVEKIFTKIHPELGGEFSEMAGEGLLDLDSRKGKAPGGYQNTLTEARKPFIFMNAVGLDTDVRTLLHEGGHAFHALAVQDDPILDYRHAPMEFCEVASMTMELLAHSHLDVFYSDEERKRSVQNHFEEIIQILAWVATVDAFQHWIYENPEHNREERRQKWVELNRRFGSGVVDWNGYEDILASAWHRQLHVFEVPFYYIEYGIAQLGALQIWQTSLEDLDLAVNQYRQALALGGSRPLPELFQTAGIRFDFSKETIEPLIAQVEKELEL